MTDPVSRIAFVEVAGIFAPRDAALGQGFAKRLPRDVKQGASEDGIGAERAKGGDTGKSAGSGTAKQVMKKRLGIVVRGVSHGHITGSRFVGDIGEDLLPRRPQGRLVGGKSRQANGPEQCFESKSELSSERFVAIGRLPPQIVVDVQEADLAPGLAPRGNARLPKKGQGDGEGDAVGAAAATNPQVTGGPAFDGPSVQEFPEDVLPRRRSTYVKIGPAVRVAGGGGVTLGIHDGCCSPGLLEVVRC